MTTGVPLSGVGAVLRCTQYVSPVGRNWCSSVWAGRTDRAVARSQSLPTPNTHELSRVVINAAVGAPDAADAELMAPMAPAPPTPVASALLNPTIVFDDEAF